VLNDRSWRDALSSDLRDRVHKRLIAAVLLLTLLVTAHGAFAQTTDVFGRTASGAPSAANAGERPSPANDTVGARPAEHRFVMPEIVRRAVGESIRWQSRLNASLQDALTSQRDGPNTLAAGMLVLLSFAYGVLHALGPGHGKLVVSTYLLSHPARIGDALLLSVWTACAQALAAIALVGGAAWLAHEGLGGVLTRASNLDLVSYIALLGVGVWTVWSVATRRDCCDDGRVSFVPRKRVMSWSRAANDTGKDEHPDAGYLGASLSRRGRACWAQSDSRQGSVWIVRQIFVTGLAVGVRPCVGAIFVLIAALANGVFMTGVLSAFAMSAGVALTVSVVGLMSLGVNRVVSTRSISNRQALQRIRRRFALSGALFITVFAAWQVFALLSGWEAASLA
jgi:nickel/cobalt transporter (NicO) family protein